MGDLWRLRVSVERLLSPDRFLNRLYRGSCVIHCQPPAGVLSDELGGFWCCSIGIGIADDRFPEVVNLSGPLRVNL
jgi:hypothetical protein